MLFVFFSLSRPLVFVACFFDLTATTGPYFSFKFCIKPVLLPKKTNWLVATMWLWFDHHHHVSLCDFPFVFATRRASMSEQCCGHTGGATFFYFDLGFFWLIYKHVFFSVLYFCPTCSHLACFLPTLTVALTLLCMKRKLGPRLTSLLSVQTIDSQWCKHAFFWLPVWWWQRGGNTCTLSETCATRDLMPRPLWVESIVSSDRLPNVFFEFTLALESLRDGWTHPPHPPPPPLSWRILIAHSSSFQSSAATKWSFQYTAFLSNWWSVRRWFDALQCLMWCCQLPACILEPIMNILDLH